MKTEVLGLLRCPGCKGRFTLLDAREQDGEIEAGRLECQGCGRRFPVVGFIPRFVCVRDLYTAAFGFQWNVFAETQLDSRSGLPISRDRFLLQTGWLPTDLAGRLILDAGCGAGRFVEIAVGFGAEVVAVDRSSAVEACWRNFRGMPRVHVIQADIYSLPFAPSTFDFVYCFGVLQHTPDPRTALECIAKQVRGGGRLAIDVYVRKAWTGLLPKYWLRRVTRHIPAMYLSVFVRMMVRALLPLSTMMGRIPWIGRRIRQIIPVANYEGVYPLSRTQLYEWSLLDTFDMLAPTYDQPQTAATLSGWMGGAGLIDVEVFRSGVLVGRGRLLAMGGDLLSGPTPERGPGCAV